MLNVINSWKKFCVKANVSVHRSWCLIGKLRISAVVDVYDEPESNEPGDDQAADDRIAEQFRRDFLEAIQSRRRGARPRNNKVTKPDVPRGPKLGGSRSARAAMREMQEKSAQK
jgi:hypothetical protein